VQPNPERIFHFFNGFLQTQAIKTAIEIGLFTAIAEGASDATSLAARTRSSEKGVRALSDYLACGGLLTKQDGRYGLAPDAAAFLDQRQPSYLGGIGRFLTSRLHVRHFDTLTEAVRRGGSVDPEGGNVSEANPVWVEFAHGMAAMMYPAAVEIAHLVGADTGSALEVLDVAAGHGMFGIQIAAGNPNARVTSLDWPDVLAVARGHAARFHLGNRWCELPGSAFLVDYGGPYDLILLTNFLHHFDRATCVSLMKKVKGALKPGGEVMTLEFIPDAESRLHPPVAGQFALVMLGTTPGGDAYTYPEWESMFQEAGFAHNELHRLERSPEQVILSRASA
jgi:2-polyprenyl-3-methyl-5-hydroxy-6-metoxy-1,4-benzoquinol methylase